MKITDDKVVRFVQVVLLIGLVLVIVVPSLIGRAHVRKSLSRMMCSKNLWHFRVQMNLYAADNQLDDQQVSLRAGLLVANTNFNREYGFYKGQTNRCGQHECNNWRFSRDGLFPSCAAASHQEALSYAGWNPPFEHPLASMPILWELEACHDGQRHVLFSNWKIQLMSDGQFHSLTNEFVQRMSALRQKH